MYSFMTSVVFKISKIVNLFFMDLLHAIKNYLEKYAFHSCGFLNTSLNVINESADNLAFSNFHKNKFCMFSLFPKSVVWCLLDC